MSTQRISQAIHNNAVWCDTVCRSHGRPGEFLEEVWLNRHQTPPFYPNVVTLAKDAASDSQLAYIQELIAAGLSGEWGVKDSYAALDLTPLGFQTVFEAEWIWRAAAQPKPASEIPDACWTRVNRAADLSAWETAWQGDSTGEMTPGQPRLFLPALLADENIAIIAAYQGERIVAGVIASRTGQVVGVSNLFVPVDESKPFRAGCLTAVIDAFPGLPLVGYEGGRDLEEMQALGFEALGPLRIWLRMDSVDSS